MVTDNGEYAIETISLTKIFGDWWGRAKVIAVDKLDLKIRHNEIYGLLGPNGSGKTTTLKMLLNLLHPTKGRALVLGGSSRNSRISERIGYLPEDSYLYRYLTARETLDFYGRIFGLPAAVRKSRIDTLLEMVGLTGMANRAVGTYSKGMARRIGLAQALINDPEILILDEPTSGMDPIGTRQMKDLFLQLAKRGKTILLCSHLLADVEDVCDRIGILYGGTMQVEGTVDELLQHRDERQILTGGISDDALEKIGRIIENEDASYTVNSPMDRLEEFFIRTVVSAQEQELPTSGAMSTTGIGGFLTEESDEPGILDQLVTAAADRPSAVEDVEIIATQKPDESTPPQQTDSGLLGKLTQSAAEHIETQIVEKTEPAELEISGAAEIKRDVLNDLLGRNETDQGLTESVEPPKTGDDEDA
ncbi:MAG: ABC transporter ATP-binding protein [Planctomycetes bacterium]|nr:ABC transporter ATP-binding protein [Planctomycetota bacterium]